MEYEQLARLAVPVGPDDHIRGPMDAPVTLVEYGDFECPYCGVAYPAVTALEQEYRGRLRVVYRNFALEQYPHAEAAAETSEFAADEGKFWEMHDMLFEHQRALDEPQLLGYARALGLDARALANALSEGTYADIVEEQKESGEASGVMGTPTFFLNGVMFAGEPTFENLADAVEYLLRQSVRR